MPTRVHLPGAGNAVTAPWTTPRGFASTWNETAAVTTLSALLTTEQLSAAGNLTARTASRATALGVQANVLCWQWVSTVTFPEVRTLGGTVSFVGVFNESVAGLDGFARIVVRILANDGTERGVLYAGGSTIEASTSLLSRAIGPVAVTPVTVQPGDRLAVEVGYQSAATATALGSLSVQAIAKTATAYLPLQDGSAAATSLPWVELSDAAIFAPSPVTGTVALSRPAFTAAAAAIRTLPTTATLAATRPAFTATAAGTVLPPGIAGPLVLARPAMRAAATGTSTPPPRTGALAGLLPTYGAALQAFAPEAASGALAGLLPALRADLRGTVAGHFNTLAATLPAFTANLAGAVPVIYRTDTTWRNDGHRHVSRATVDYDPPVVAPPPHLHRQDVRRVHQSLPTPTIVKGRPQ